MSEQKAFPSHALAEFFKGHDSARAKEELKAKKRNAIIEEKKKTMYPMAALLKSLVTIGITLRDGRTFSFYERDSSPMWSPGVSLCFDHPSPIEIAIPNEPLKEGAIVIKVAAEDKESHFLEKKFDTIEAGMDALAAYLGRHTIKLEIDIRKKVGAAQRKEESSRISNRDRDDELPQDRAV